MSNKATYPALILSALVCLLPLSCSRTFDDVQSPQRSDEPIDFSAASFPELTKAPDPLQDTNIVNFGIAGILSYDSLSTNQWYLEKQIVYRNPVNRNFYFNTPAYWPLFGDLSFFSYLPVTYSDTKAPITFVESSTGFPYIEFTPSNTDIINQTELCIGRPLMHLTKANNPIHIQFEHALTRMIFSAKYTGSIPSGLGMLITELKVKNVVGTKKVYYSTSAPYYVWEGDSAHSADSSYTLSTVLTHLQQRVITGNYESITNTVGNLYLLPQTLGPDAALEVHYGFYANASAASPTPMALYVKEVPLPQGQLWPAAKTVHYKLSIDVGVSSPIGLECSITDWNSSGNTHTQYEFQ